MLNGEVPNLACSVDAEKDLQKTTTIGGKNELRTESEFWYIF